MPQVRGLDVRRGGPEIYKVLFLRILNLVEYLVEGCPEKTQTPERLR